MAVAVAKAIEDGADGIVCASTGNTAASAAAYAARAGLTAVVLHPAGRSLPRSRPRRGPSVRGCSRCAAASTTRSAAASSWWRRGTFALVNSLNPHRIEGQKTAASRSPRSSAARPTCSRCPTAAAATCARTPRASPRTARFRGWSPSRRPSAPSTLASAIRIAEPAHREEVDALVAAGRASRHRRRRRDHRPWLELASLEGVFCEPSSAAGLAGARARRARAGSTVVCVLTGHGLKDTAAVDVLDRARRRWSTPNVEAILAEVGP